MLEKLAQKRKLIAIIYGVILLALFITHLVWGNAEDKNTIAIVTLIGFPFFYFGVKLMFKIVRINASKKVMTFFSWFFLCGAGVLGSVLCLVDFIRLFPNGFSPSLSCIMGMLLAILSDVNKHAEKN